MAITRHSLIGIDTQHRQCCTKIIEDFGLGNKDRLFAILDIQSSIPHQLLGDASFRSVLRTYYRMLKTLQTYHESDPIVHHESELKCDGKYILQFSVSIKVHLHIISFDKAIRV
jgi:hypothetical protein